MSAAWGSKSRKRSVGRSGDWQCRGGRTESAQEDREQKASGGRMERNMQEKGEPSTFAVRAAKLYAVSA